MAREFYKFFVITWFATLLLVPLISSYPSEEIDPLSQKELSIRLNEHLIKIANLEGDVAVNQGKISRLAEENSVNENNIESLEAKNVEKDKMLAEILYRLKALEEFKIKCSAFEDKITLLEEKNRASETDYSEIKNKLDDLESKFISNDKKMGDIDLKITQTEKNVIAFDVKYDSQLSKIKKWNIEQDNEISILKTKVAPLDSKISEIQYKLTDVELLCNSNQTEEKFITFQARYDFKISQIEGENLEQQKQINNLKNKTSLVEKQNADIQIQITDLKTKVTSNEKKIDIVIQKSNQTEKNVIALGLNNSDLDKRITKIEKKNVAQDKEIDALKTKISPLQNENAKILKKVTNIEGKFTSFDKKFEGLQENINQNGQQLGTLEAKNAQIEEKNLKQDQSITSLNDKISSIDLLNSQIKNNLTSLEINCSGNLKKLDFLIVKNNQCEERFGGLDVKHAKYDGQLLQIEKKNDEQDEEIVSLKSKTTTQSELLISIQLTYCEKIFGKTECSSLKETQPTSCRDLAIRGHSFNGLYAIKNPETGKIQTVHCLFGTSVSQELIDDVTTVSETKATSPTTTYPTSPATTKPIEDDFLFHAIKLYNQETAPSFFNRVVTFERYTWNYREGLNLASGIFTVPSKGFYMFEGHVLKGMHLQVNGVYVKWSEEVNHPLIPFCLKTIARVTLNAGDRVNLFNYQSNDPIKGAGFPVELMGIRVNSVSQELVIGGSAKPIEDDFIFHVTKIYDRKTAPSFFNRVVTYDRYTWNYRDGLNLTSGIFTVPSKGSYMFEGHVIKGMNLQVNGVYVKWNEEMNSYHSSIPFFLKTIARVTLNAGDRVNLFYYQSNNPVENSGGFIIQLKGIRVNKNN